MRKTIYVLLAGLLIAGCVPPDDKTQKNIDACMQKGWTPTYVSTMQATIFRCDAPGKETDIKLGN